MSQVLDNPGLARRPDTEVLADLEVQPLSKVMREETHSSHGRAEHSAFEQALVKGKLKVEAYRDLMAQTYYIYCALEEVSAQLSKDAVAGPFYMPELNRRDAIEADLAFYYGDDWRDQIRQRPVTEEYVARIYEVAKDPARFIAHHYTRYLADLSGGLMIDRGIKRAYGLDVDGRRYYIFDKIGDPNEFKQRYRGMLDALAVDSKQKLAVVDEALQAYALNIALIDELSDAHAPFEVDDDVAISS